MRITHVRISALESGPGYNNRSCALEAEIEEGENYAEVAEDLRQKIDGQIRTHREIDGLCQSRDSLREEVRYLEQQRDGLRRDIEKGRKIIRAHSKLADLARKNNLDAQADQLDDGIPF